MTEPKDGFDLLDFPCEFQFKAMVRVAGLGDGQSASQAMQGLIESNLPDANIVSVSSAASRTGRFESVSLTMQVEDRTALEQVYEVLAKDDNVVMTL